jgi:hypothetical protein
MTEHPLQPPPGINLVDAICISADRRERQQAQAPDMMMQMTQAMMTMMQQQSTMIALLAQIVTNQDAKPDKPKAGGSK